MNPPSEEMQKLMNTGVEYVNSLEALDWDIAFEKLLEDMNKK